MLVTTMEDKEDGRKWEIFKESDGSFFYKYYEYFKEIGWRLTIKSGRYSKDAIEWEFDITIE